MLANAWLWSNIPITVPITNVTANPIPKVTSFGCAVIIFMILSLNDIYVIYDNKLYKDIVKVEII